MIVFNRDYIASTPATSCELHKHTMPHLIISTTPFHIFIDGKDYVDYNFVVIRGNVEHKIKKITKESLVLLISPITPLYFGIIESLDTKLFYGTIIDFLLKINPQSISEFEELIKLILNKMPISYEYENGRITDERIKDILRRVAENEYCEISISEIAKAHNLSTSRLEHLFAEQTGIRLKNLILMYKLKNAYNMVSQGSTVTEAAYASGFSDSSHLAATAKKTTGISISSFYK